MEFGFLTFDESQLFPNRSAKALVGLTESWIGRGSLRVGSQLFQDLLVGLAGFIEKTLRKVELSLIYLFLDLREAIGAGMVDIV